MLGCLTSEHPIKYRASCKLQIGISTRFTGDFLHFLPGESAPSVLSRYTPPGEGTSVDRSGPIIVYVLAVVYWGN